jgi:hypothetical protein
VFAHSVNLSDVDVHTDQNKVRRGSTYGRPVGLGGVRPSRQLSAECALCFVVAPHDIGGL